MEAQTIQSTPSAIDLALAAARARASQRTADPEEKAARDAARAEAREKLKAEREARKAAAEEKRVQTKREKSGPVHMKKVERAASQLPAISTEAKQMLDEIVSCFGLVDMTVLAAHLQHHVRVKQTAAAHGRKFTIGQRVRIVGGDARYIGREGTVDQARNIRCFVSVPGVNKPVYVFTSDIEALEE